MTRYKVIKDAIQRLSNPQIRRFALREGIASVSGLIYEEIRVLIFTALKDLLRMAIIAMTTAKRRTVILDDVRLVLRVGGKHLATNAPQKYSIPDGGKRKKLNSIQSERAKSQFIFDRASFTLLCRERAQEYADDLRFSADALLTIQVYIERLISTIFSRAYLVLVADTKQTLQPSHLRAVTSILDWQLTPKVSLSVDGSNKLNRLPANTVSKVLTALNSEMSLDSEAKKQLAQLAVGTAERVLAVAHQLVTHTDKKTLSTVHLQPALRMVIAPGALQKSFISNNTSMVTKFYNAQGKRSSADLQLPIARVENMMRSARVVERISSAAPIYLASTIHVLLAELLEIAAEKAKSHKKVRITPSHIRAAISSDPELQQLFSRTLYAVA